MAPRPTEPSAADVYEFGSFELDVAGRSLYRSGEFVALAPKVFDTLLVLVQDAGRVVTKEQLLERVWLDTFVEEGSITNYISTLRKILNPHFEGVDPITTVARRGYRFSAAVRLRSARAEISLVSEAPPPVPPPRDASAPVSVPSPSPRCSSSPPSPASRSFSPAARRRPRRRRDRADRSPCCR